MQGVIRGGLTYLPAALLGGSNENLREGICKTGWGWSAEKGCEKHLTRVGEVRGH